MPNPPDKNCQTNIPFELSTTFQADVKKHFITFLKDIFMALPYCILNFSAVTALHDTTSFFVLCQAASYVSTISADLMYDFLIKLYLYTVIYFVVYFMLHFRL